LVFYVVRDGDNWKLVNVLIDGINLRVTFRNQFANLMEKYSKVGAAIDHWEEAMSSVAEGGV
jgi:phospholipid transport system substrate-binding protein